MELAATDLVATDPAAAIDEIVALVREFLQRPTLELLRRLEQLWNQVRPQLRTVGPALAGAVATLARSISALVAALASPAVIATLGVTAGVGSAFLLFWLIALGSIRAVETLINRVSDALDWIILELKVALSDLNLPRSGREWDPCWEAFRSALVDAFITEGKLSATPGVIARFNEALEALIQCLFKDVDLAEDFGILSRQADKLRDLLEDLLRRFFPVALGPIIGLVLPGEGLAGEPDPEEITELVERTGLTGKHRRDGFDYSELITRPSDDEPLGRGDVDVNVSLPLRGFTPEQLKMRKESLERFIAEIESEIKADEAELAGLASSPQGDSSRIDLLRVRLEALRRELRRLRAALENTRRVHQDRVSGQGQNNEGGE